MEIKNLFIRKLYDEKRITAEEVETLFEDKMDYSLEKSIKFNTLLQKIIDFEKTELDLSYIHFLDFIFRDFYFKKIKSINFFHSTFSKDLDFSKESIQQNLDFTNTLFEEKVSFHEAVFNGHVVFIGVTFKKSADFTKTDFQETLHFDKSIFEEKAYFKESTFSKYVSFKGATFYDYANFRRSTFKARATLRGIRSKDLVNFSNSSFYDLDLENTQFSNANYLHISGLDKGKTEKVAASKKHFTNKESARLIKTHFEKQNNITESNKYFQIEQELYIEHLKRSATEPNKLPTLTTLYLSKLISNFGTDWIRALLLLLMMGMGFMLIYIGLDTYLSSDSKAIKHFTHSEDILYILLMTISYMAFYTSTFYKNEKSSFWVFMSIGFVVTGIALGNYGGAIEIQNYMIQLTNPINAFKKENLYEGLELYGVLVHLVVTVIIYQLVVAFRQHTRRK